MQPGQQLGQGLQGGRGSADTEGGGSGARTGAPIPDSSRTLVKSETIIDTHPPTSYGSLTIYNSK